MLVFQKWGIYNSTLKRMLLRHDVKRGLAKYHAFKSHCQILGSLRISLSKRCNHKRIHLVDSPSHNEALTSNSFSKAANRATDEHGFDPDLIRGIRGYL